MELRLYEQGGQITALHLRATEHEGLFQTLSCSAWARTGGPGQSQLPYRGDLGE